MRAEGIRVKCQQELVAFDKVAAAYSKATLERGEGEALLLTQKIKQNGKVYENGSRQTIEAIEGGKMRFRSGLELDLNDGRVRQGDAVTTYKAQGASRTEMIRVEDNRSLTAMANREDLHVAFTRHRAIARMFVQDVDVLRKAAQRSVIEEMSARDLEQTVDCRFERKIDPVVERVPSTQTKVRQFERETKAAVERRRELIRELRFRKRQTEARRQEREQSRGMSM